MSRWLTNYFGYTSFRQECLAALTTFLTMSYIVVVNPLLLKDAGMDPGAVFVATCLIAAAASIFMGFYANYPIALAPGLSIATYFSYVVVGQLGYAWPDALGAVLIAAVLFFLVSLLRWRTDIINAIPEFLKIGITCGIGLFIAVIAFKNAQILTVAPGHLITWAQPLAWPALLTYVGMAMIVLLQRMRIPGAIFLTIIILTIFSNLLHYTHFHGVFALPPLLQPTLLKLNLQLYLQPAFWGIVLSIFFVAFFDATGTLLGLLHQAGLPSNTQDPRFARALIADSSAAIVGACLGTTTVGAYIENAAGIIVGGRTGMTAVLVGLLFLAALFLSPLIQTIPNFATASALLYVAYLMLSNIRQLDWRDPTVAISTALTICIMPLTFSIVYGIATGFITFILMKIIKAQGKELNRWQWILGALFVCYLAIDLLH